MIRLLLALVMFAPLAARADVAVGGDLALLFRDEAGGNRTVLPSVSPRATYGFTGNLRGSAWYALAFAGGSSDVLDVRTQHHRLGLGAEWVQRVRKADFVGSAGFAGVFMHSTIIDHGKDGPTSNVLRPAVWAALALEVPLDAVTLRWSTTFVLERARQDGAVGIGVVMPLGKR